MSAPSLLTYGGRLHEVGYPGGAVDMNYVEWQNRINDQASPIPFGALVARSTAASVAAGTAIAGACKLPAADGDIIIGIAGKHIGHPSPGYGQTSAGFVGYLQNDAVPVGRDGDFYVTATENVTQDDAVLSLTATPGAAGGTTSGAAGAGRVVVRAAYWQTTTAAGQLGIVRIKQ